MNKPTCKVRGMIRRGAMCGHVIVGAMCAYTGKCPHKVAAPAAEPVKDDAADLKGGA